MTFKYFTSILLSLLFLAGCTEPAIEIDTSYRPSALEYALPGNHLAFIDQRGDRVFSRPEINGWLFLEANLRSALGKESDKPLEQALNSFGDQGVAGWWPDRQLSEGKKYFLGMPPITLYVDADVTAWMLRERNQLISEDNLRAFLSGEPIPEPWQSACNEVQCERPQMIRVWGEQDWHDELDVATTSSLLAVLDIHRSPLARRVFDQNSKLINHIIANHDYREFMGYYEPHASGSLLILFNHRESENPFLNTEAEQVLLADLESELHKLQSGVVSSWWGTGKERIGGYQLAYESERLPDLMFEYAETILQRELNID